MTTDSSATTREPHVNRTTRTATIIDALKQRALAVLNDKSIDARSRDIIRRALETNDPWLAGLVRQAEAGESIVDPPHSSQTSEEYDANKKIEALAEMICAAGDESSAALLVLMGMPQNSTDPKALANTAKHFAFARCGELNLYGMVDEQIAVLEHELFGA